MIGVLREALADRTHPPESIFRAATDSARILTGATGTALALKTDGIVVCRASNGENVPKIGSPLDVNSGISGECFRRAMTLRCDDTQIDDRVDPELCRELGIFSIAVVPVHGLTGPAAGILEAFSNRPYSFTTEHITALEQLAEIVATANLPELNLLNPDAPVTEKPPGEISWLEEHRLIQEAREPSLAETANQVRPAVAEAVTTVPDPIEERRNLIRRELYAATTAATGTWRTVQESSGPSRRYWVLGAAVILLLTFGVIWMSWRSAGTEAAEIRPSTTAASPEPEVPANTAATVAHYKPAAGHAEGRGIPAGIVTNAAKIEATAEGRSRNSRAAQLIVPPSPSAAASSHPSDQLLPAEAPPEVSMQAETGTSLENLASAAALKLPQADLPISQGVASAVLIHKVDPVYPLQARTERLGGSVTIEATIAEDGSTRDLKTLSGLPTLARAASEAVSQWRYRPALLNGKPVAVQKQIIVVFRAP